LPRSVPDANRSVITNSPWTGPTIGSGYGDANFPTSEI
jgi:hypothetical protein